MIAYMLLLFLPAMQLQPIDNQTDAKWRECMLAVPQAMVRAIVQEPIICNLGEVI